MGGGSSNAGTLLKVLCQKFETKKDKVLILAKNLGADVPFFMMDYPASIARGIGEILEEYPSYSAYYLLIYPGFQINTAWAYKNLNFEGIKTPIIYEEHTPPWRQPQGLINDFKELLYKIHPEYSELEALLRKEGALSVSITGTGSTIFGVFENFPLFAWKGLKKTLKNAKIFLVKNLE